MSRGLFYKAKKIDIHLGLEDLGVGRWSNEFPNSLLNVTSNSLIFWGEINVARVDFLLHKTILREFVYQCWKPVMTDTWREHWYTLNAPYMTGALINPIKLTMKKTLIALSIVWKQNTFLKLLFWLLNFASEVYSYLVFYFS